MKKIVVGLVLALFLPLQACAQVKLWQEGKHYNVISEQASAKPVVKEYFSFWCPACFRFEPLIGELKGQLPEGVEFDKVHVNFMRFSSPEVQDYATKAMMIAQQLGNEALISSIFNYIHVQQQGRNISKLEDFRDLFVVNGVEGETFDKYAKSFAVNSLVKKNNREVQTNKEFINGVPNIIVNEKYQVILGSVQSAQEYIDLIVWLSQQK